MRFYGPFSRIYDPGLRSWFRVQGLGCGVWVERRTLVPPSSASIVEILPLCLLTTSCSTVQERSRFALLPWLWDSARIMDHAVCWVPFARALPTEEKVESGTSQSKSRTSVNLSNRGISRSGFSCRRALEGKKLSCKRSKYRPFKWLYGPARRV